MARRVVEACTPDAFYFIPCRQTLLKKQATASCHHRLNLLQIALAAYPEFNIDIREMERPTPSYTVDTLTSYRQQFPQDSLTWLLGMDAFLSLPQWHRADELLLLSNFLVLNRPGYDFDPSLALKRLCHNHKTDSIQELSHTPNGLIHQLTMPELPQSSREIRRKIAEKQSLTGYLSPETIKYIARHRLYNWPHDNA